MKMKKINERIVSIFLSFVLIVMLIPLSGIIALAETEKATHIDVYTGTVWETKELGVDTLPEGMSYDSVKDRIVLDGYNGYSFGPGDLDKSISIYVVGENIINGRLGHADGTQIELVGTTGSELKINFNDVNSCSILGSVVATDVEIYINTTCTGNIYPYLWGINGSVELNGKYKLNMYTQNHTSYGVDSIGISGELTLNDESGAYVIVLGDENNDNVTGVAGKLNLNGTGECFINVFSENENPSIKLQAVGEEPIIANPEAYELDGAWDSDFVHYKPIPKIVEGNNSKWVKGTDSGLTFKSSAPHKDFEQVKIDETLLSADKYELSEGSTVVTLKPDYLETLTVGKHKIDIYSEGGIASGNFEVLAKAAVATEEEIAQTGDMNNAVSQLVLVVALGGLAAVAGVARRKEDK